MRIFSTAFRHLLSCAAVVLAASSAADIPKKDRVLPVSPLVSESSESLSNWLTVVRSTPYWMSKGTYQNLLTIRRWVLFGESYCENPKRHILFNRQAEFLGYVDNARTVAKTQAKLNIQRHKLAKEKRAKLAVSGNKGQVGYPFALSCDQPHADLRAALARYSGKNKKSRLWGTWDGMKIGSKNNHVSLHEAITMVYRDRLSRQHISLSEDVLSSLAGTILIESGGRKKAHSTADARGILQLSPAALSDCNLAEKFHFHRMAQIDCSLQLLEVNHRNLQPSVRSYFGHLAEKKLNRLYSLLLIQAYHGGVGRVNSLMNDKNLNKAASYFAEHHATYSAEDIALGMIFHNLGRNQLGLNSLYYVTDVGIAHRLICDTYAGLAGC